MFRKDNVMIFKNIKFDKKPYGGWTSKTFLGGDMEISIVGGLHCYSTPREDLDDPFSYSKYEIAVFKNGEFTREFFDDGNHNDDVMGWVSPEEILTLIEKIQNGFIWQS